MHKSVYKLGFFLIASLVMLLPFGISKNIFPNATAIEEDYGYYEQYHPTYETDMTNEYVDEYVAQSYGNTNYESEYPLYSNDNNYDSKNIDFPKKIKCNNINSNINGVEGTTDLNGLLGVGDTALQGDEDASANTYGYGYKNNGNFNLDCINNNDNEGGQGLAGPQGPQGSQGPQGPAGPNQILSSNLYRADGELETVEDGVIGQSITNCDTGDTVIEGGFQIDLGQNIGRPTLFFDGPLPNPNNDFPSYSGPNNSAYATVIGSPDPPNSKTVFRSYAYCFDNPPLRP